MWEKLKIFALKHPNLLSFFSFLLFFLCLVYFLGWLLALLVSLSLAAHEYSHVLAMRLFKLNVRAVIFIPFLGAVALGGNGKEWTRARESVIALAGPLAGYLSAVPVFFLFKGTHQFVFAMALYFILLINLFNLLPLSPLDGGRVVKSLLMSFKKRIIGFILWAILGLLVIFTLGQIGVSLIVSFLVILAAWREFLSEWKFYKMRKMIIEWIEKEAPEDAFGFEVFANLSADEKLKMASFLPEKEKNRMIYVICHDAFDRLAALKLLADGANPPYLRPLTIQQRVIFIVLYFALISVPALFYLGLR